MHVSALPKTSTLNTQADAGPRNTVPADETLTTNPSLAKNDTVLRDLPPPEPIPKEPSPSVIIPPTKDSTPPEPAVTPPVVPPPPTFEPESDFFKLTRHISKIPTLKQSQQSANYFFINNINEFGGTPHSVRASSNYGGVTETFYKDDKTEQRSSEKFHVSSKIPQTATSPTSTKPLSDNLLNSETVKQSAPRPTNRPPPPPKEPPPSLPESAIPKLIKSLDIDRVTLTKEPVDVYARTEESPTFNKPKPPPPPKPLPVFRATNKHAEGFYSEISKRKSYGSTSGLTSQVNAFSMRHPRKK